MLPLATFAMTVYENTDCSCFALKKSVGHDTDTKLEIKMHKAITIIQFKLEGQLIAKHPEFDMDNRCLLHKINFDNKTVEVDGEMYPMKDTDFPTISRKNPYALTEREAEVMEKLRSAFINCEKLQKHTQLLLKKGGMYKTYNGNLLFHGCMPLNNDGSFKELKIDGCTYSGKALFDVFEEYCRKALLSLDREQRKNGGDILWYLWNGPDSPLFGRTKMSTFERYFIEDTESHKEKKNAYYSL